MDAGSNAKSALSVQKHAIEKITFACAVHASNRYNSNRTFDVAQDLDGLGVYLKHCFKGIHKLETTRRKERHLLLVLGLTVMSGRAFSGNLNFVSYFANFNSADVLCRLAGICSPTIPYKLVVELLNWSTRLMMSISDESSSLG